MSQMGQTEKHQQEQAWSRPRTLSGSKVMEFGELRSGFADRMYGTLSTALINQCCAIRVSRGSLARRPRHYRKSTSAQHNLDCTIVSNPHGYLLGQHR